MFGAVDDTGAGAAAPVAARAFRLPAMTRDLAEHDAVPPKRSATMRLRAVFLASLLIPAVMPVALPARAAGTCPSTAAKPSQPPKLEIPQDAKITSKETAYEVDIGSDGRVRGLQMDETSGDGAVDLSIKQTLQAAAFDPPQSGCVAHSGGLRMVFGLPAPDGVAAPTPPAKLNTNCTPFVSAFITPSARDRKRTGTATVAIELDAAGTETAAPVLQKSTGSPVLDQEALRIAKTAQFNFLRDGPCAPQPFAYALELTFQ